MIIYQVVFLHTDPNDEEVKMKRSYDEKLLDPSEYCLVQYNGTSIFDRIAKACKNPDNEVETRFS